MRVGCVSGWDETGAVGRLGEVDKGGIGLCWWFVRWAGEWVEDDGERGLCICVVGVDIGVVESELLGWDWAVGFGLVVWECGVMGWDVIGEVVDEADIFGQ